MVTDTLPVWACALTLRWSGRARDKVPSSYHGVRAAQLNREVSLDVSHCRYQEQESASRYLAFVRPVRGERPHHDQCRGRRAPVSGIDTSDGERPEIHGITWSQEKGILEFSAHWPVTGRLTKYRFSTPSSESRTDVCYTFTVQQTWERL